MLHHLHKKILSIFGKRKYLEIAPDEIFLDSENLPEFDTSQFEGRIERPIPLQTFIIFAGFCALLSFFFIYKVWALEIKEGETYAEISANNSLRHDVIVAPRGVIYDRNGELLAWNKAPQLEEFYSGRKYIEAGGFSHLLGFVKYPAKDTSGYFYREEYDPQDGIELYLNEIVAGKNGLKITETDASFEVVSESLIDKPNEGAPLSLAIDSRIQKKIYEEIVSLAGKVGFQGGAGLLIDVNSGEILVMTSFPEYSSQIMTEGDDVATIESYAADNDKPFLNRLVTGLYTPGSVVKPFLAFGALTEGIITPEKTIVSTGKLVVPNPYFPAEPSVFNDWKAHGAVDMRHAIAVSSNVYFYQIGGGYGDQKGLGIENIGKYLKMFGLGVQTGIGISTEETGNIPNPEWKEKTFNGEPWRLGDTYNTAIGQYGMQVTPIQIVRAIAALANGGVLVEPTFIKQSTTTVPLGERIGGNPEYYQIIREGMRLGVMEGTSKGLDVPYVKVAGKTGTAQLGAAKQLVNSWTAGFFPYDNPRYAYMVVMERGPVTNLTGATFVMRQTIDWMNINTPEYFD